jgi:hypothetical protein
MNFVPPLVNKSKPDLLVVLKAFALGEITKHL